MEKHQLIDNEELNQYEYHIDSYIPHIEYKKRKNEIALIHTSMPEDLRGQGIGTQLIKDTLDDISRQGLKVIPICGAVAHFMKKHPEYNRLLKEGIYIG